MAALSVVRIVTLSIALVASSQRALAAANEEKQIKVMPSKRLSSCSAIDCPCVDLEARDLQTGAAMQDRIPEAIRAIRYWPEPIGYGDVFRGPGRTDPYTQIYEGLHDRDLTVIRRELGANALLLGAWSIGGRSHAQFLAKAEKERLSVIPAFDIEPYWQDGAWQKQTTRDTLRKEFLDFLQNTAVHDDGKLRTPNSVLMWNLVGLPPLDALLPKSCTVAAMTNVENFKNCVSSTGDLADALVTIQNLQEILQGVRETQRQFHCQYGSQWRQECASRDDDVGVFKFDRPLALTLELGPDFYLTNPENDAYLAAFVFWMERILGCRPVAPGQVLVPETFKETEAHCLFNGYGFFDFWILKFSAVADDIEAKAVRRAKDVFSPPRQRIRRSDQEPPTTVNDVSGAMKPALIQYGFPAYLHGSLQVEKQHRALQDVWWGGEAQTGNQSRGLKDAWTNGYCIKGAAIDEWNDVWSADQLIKSCEDIPKSQFGHSSCGPLTDSGELAVSYQGLVSQFNTWGMHCIDKRFKVNGSGFKFLMDSDLEDVVGQTACAGIHMRRGLTSIAFYAVSAASILIALASLCGLVCRRRRENQIDEQKIKQQSCHNLERLMQTGSSRKILEDISAMPFGKLLATKVAEALEHEALEVPVKYDHLRGYSGWGIAKTKGIFSYHRLQYDGRGRGSAVQTWDSSEAFIRWLQEQSDRQMAAYGFTDEELRRNDLIGNKTITRKHLLELLEANGCFQDVKDVIGKVEAELPYFGRAVQVSIDVRYKASPLFLCGVVDESQAQAGEEDDMPRWLARSETDMRHFLTLLANTHLRVQADRLHRQMQHEAHAVLADDQRSQKLGLTAASAHARACYNVWCRVLEGYHSWQKFRGASGQRKAFDETQSDRYFVEALIARLIESMGEQLVHAPEWLASVFDKILWTLQDSLSANGVTPCFTCDLDYADLSEPLDIFCRNSNIFLPKQGINFDDINDCGLSASAELPSKDVRKTWKEPIGPWVFFHFVVNYKWVLTIALWLLCSAFLLYDSKAYADWTGSFPGDPTTPKLTAFNILLVDACWLGFLVFCELFVDGPPTLSHAASSECKKKTSKALRALRIIPVICMGLLWFCVEWPDHVERAWVLLGQDDSTFDALPVDLAENFWYVPSAYMVLRLVYGLLPRLSSWSAVKLRQMNWRRLVIFWSCFAALCFMCNYFLLVGLVRSLTPYKLCKLEDQREDFCASHNLVFSGSEVSVKDSRCVACLATIATSWSMVCLSSLLMMYFIFNVFVAILGSSVGAARGFVDTTISKLDFHVEAVTSDFVHMRKAEAGWMTHGSILHAMFGKDWLRVWEMMVDGLYDECLIDSQMRKQLLTAAKCGGSVKLKDKTHQMLERACARLGYLFTSLRAILSDKTIDFRPFSGSSTYDDAACDALGMTHKGRLPSLTQIVPVYSEEGIMDIKDLIGDPKQGAVSTTLEFLISQMPKEWRIFAENEDMHPTELYDKMKNGDCTKEQTCRVREWASHRAQSVIRTVNGAVHYHKALQLLLHRNQTVGAEEIREHAQLIVAHQTYGKVSLGKALHVKIQHGVIITQGIHGHGLRPNDRVRLTLDALHTGDDVAKRAVAMLTESRAVAKIRQRAKVSDAHEGEALLTDGWTAEASSSEQAQEGAIGQEATLLGVSTAERPPPPAMLSPSRHPALLGRLWGPSSPKGLQSFKSGGFFVVKEVLDENTAVLSDESINCGTARLEKAEVTQRERDLHYMLQKHEGYPFFVAIDFQRGKSHPFLEELIDEHIAMHASASSGGQPLRFKHASVLIRLRTKDASGAPSLAEGGEGCLRSDDWPVEVVHVLPRARGLLAGSQGNLSQGKAGNQLGALRFAEGHFLQMMDANMGCYAGETFKVPIVLQGFHRKQVEGGDSNHRVELEARIIGFREHIFTREHGLVGKIMADAEWTFGTLVQRLLEFLTVRMHYGHPDFMDGFWASNRGSVSKASPHINLSEDIFAGLNVKTRKEQSLHTDYLEWEKGREVQFLAGSGFFWKIASGSVGLLRTRDLRALCGNASIMESLALYFATVAWYLHNVIVDISTELFVLIFVYLALASKSINDLGELGSMLAAEWFLTPAFSAMLPAIVGLGIEYGPVWMFRNYLLSAPMSMIYFVFINKSMSSSVRTTFFANTAEYVNTGRPHANRSYTLMDAFQAFRTSHYMPALQIIYVIVLYRIMNSDAALPMILVSFTAFVWIAAPVLFQPPTKTVLEQTRELVHFIAKAPSRHDRLVPGKPCSLYEAALEQELKRANRPLGLSLLVSSMLCALYLFMVTSDVFDQVWAPVCGLLVLFIFRSILRCTGVKQAGMVVLIVPGLVLLVIFFTIFAVENPNVGDLLISALVLEQFLRTTKLLIWAFFSMVLPRASQLRFEQIVRFTFDCLGVYELHFFGSLVVVLVQMLLASLLWVLDRPPLRLRTGLLLNRSVSVGCVSRIFGAADQAKECDSVHVDVGTHLK
eukprot:TRINITY_DN4690_c0_g1_i2.p1 TRINITY_DN4690_c0_g1~~TRINITY_DN4690_c0_g1_i2.p1  ORF type:complete len:2474 (-),score=434.83 TRINITY_DN4690_c0_g1_i2:272-7693(-)